MSCPISRRNEFQSTHPRGVRLGLFRPVFFGMTGFQSTHPRGVRPLSSSGTSILAKGFNPRTRVGCDPAPGWGGTAAQKFQSTHPRGVRRAPCNSPCGSSMFQSTHPRGVRHAPRLRQGRLDKVSIHAPAWGATTGVALVPLGARSFNPRTRVGCDFLPATGP